MNTYTRSVSYPEFNLAQLGKPLVDAPHNLLKYKAVLQAGRQAMAARRPAARLGSQPALGLGFGFVVAVVFPAAAILAMILIVTIPLGLISLAVYVAAAYLARLVAAQATGAPWPVEQDLADAVDPVRWALREARASQAGAGD